MITRVLFGISTFAMASHVHAQEPDVFNAVVARYASAAASWESVVLDAASWLFWTLAAISMVWTFGTLALRKADAGDFLAEFFRFAAFTGFFFWLLTNGPAMAESIFGSMQQLASRSTGLSEMDSSGIVQVGFEVFAQVLQKSSIWSPIDSLIGAALSVGILVVLALVSINMLLLLISAWILAYAGIFFLGFGGSRWTSDLAITYFRTVLGIAVQLFVMLLIVGIGKTFLDDYYRIISGSGLALQDMGVMVVVAVTLLVLSVSVPRTVAGIATGGGLNTGVGINAASIASVASAAVAVGAATVSGGVSAAASAAGGKRAVGAALSAATSAVDAGRDLLAPRPRMSEEARRRWVESVFWPPRPVRVATDAGAKAAQAAYGKVAEQARARIADTKGSRLADAIREREGGDDGSA